MSSLRTITNSLAIGLSGMCFLHCLIIPLVIVLLPSLAALPLENEAFHLWIVLLAIPAGLYSLTMGCKQHKRYQLLALGAFGLTLLVLAVLFGESAGELFEKSLTVIGAIIIAYAHIQNHRLCKKTDDCCSGKPVADETV